MTSIGVLLVILGVGSLILPYLGLQFRLMELVDPYQPWAGIVVAALGLVLILVASRRKSGDVAQAEADQAVLGLVRDVGADELGDQGIADFLCRRTGIAGRPDECVMHHRDAESSENFFACGF